MSMQEHTSDKPNEAVKAAAEMMERVSDGSDMTNTTSGIALDSTDNIGQTDKRIPSEENNPVRGQGIAGGATTMTDTVPAAASAMTSDRDDSPQHIDEQKQAMLSSQ